MTYIPHWAIDPFDIVWKNFLDTNSTFNSIQEKINYPVDICEVEEGLRFELAAVGLEEKDITILVDGDTLRITHDKQEKDNERSWIQRGITRRSFDLAYKVVAKFDLSKLVAKLDKGLLILDIPYAANKVPRKIPINTKNDVK